MVLAFAVQRGWSVWVTSGSEEKINRATEMGAKGGVSYKEDGWEKKLLNLLPEGRMWIDAVVDSAGGDIVDKTLRLLKVSCLQMYIGFCVLTLA
jgi:NADPH:quinone reductase-like Zn-dependent oxidoreductase